MLSLKKNKLEALKRLSNENGVIGALAIDQRGSLKKMIANASDQEIGDEGIITYKKLVSEELTPFASSILLDPEYGLPASKIRHQDAGLIMAYEKTGYDASEPGRLPDLLEEWSVKRLKDLGADAIKFLLYYDVDEEEKINEYKHVYMERIGSECEAEEIPFFLEIVTYDANNDDVKGKEYAKVKPHKVIDAMKEFSKPQYKVDVLKVEVPVNMKFVEGYGDEVIHSREEALQLFKEQSDATTLPFIFLSAGVSAQLFQDTLTFAKEAGSTFNGVLCGRATWKNGVNVFGEKGEQDGREWLRSEGRQNIEELNAVLKETASPWFDKVENI
ncbi:tagatose-bisphosphate aldolase [Bacillus cereus group sp. MYBK12-2]|uniref:Tagatose 1,6-diphosphate aldolase n=3 Tax=Bacillus cereus group TaxID=86661 RepID=A0A150AUR5_BACCE|nr:MULTISPECIES: tagatose-bisphosphate aldolase [Bacillus cereus group]EEK41924.1 Tagatose 1,6-diphosphate aldolase 2 [Bacillus cereus m1293]EJR42744.1 tagatose 1,6-diphosphate aldolase [Bacillus cereus VD102]MBQ6447069.1 tagatose-bisphosphate aldolase [Bacillus sp. (in: firmicutes)]MBR3118789.1 tagatose-bisphosphate aldolase [Oceanobacillus sp.]HDR7337311.1 tagatose-bisphosphate aldolase [Bacillus anthracis]